MLYDPGNQVIANQHRVFEIVYPTEDNRRTGEHFLVMGEQEIKGMVIG
jgi:hypothetical protein